MTLLTLLSAQRIQTVHLLDIRNMSITDSIVKVSIGDKLKQSRAGHHLYELEFPAYSPDQRLCPVSDVKQYLTRTKPLRGEITNLFTSFVRPYRSVSKSTISRWVKNVPLATILRTAGWSSECTFVQYYRKEVQK